MACKGAKHAKLMAEKVMAEAVQAAAVQPETQPKEEQTSVIRLLFGADSSIRSDDLLQNNISEFEWAVRNKAYPNFWGRNLAGENALTEEEIRFLHSKGCKIAAVYGSDDVKETREQGRSLAEKIEEIAIRLNIPEGVAIFLEIGESEPATTDFMLGFAECIIEKGFIPAFRANTDAKFSFDREFSRGLQTDREIFEKCLIWAVSPSLAEYDSVTTTHLIHPDNWGPFAPSGITRNDIAVWQYGRNCHPINDDAGKKTSFNVNLVRDEKVIIEKMF